MNYRFRVSHDWASPSTKLYLWSTSDGYESFYHTIENGLLTRHPKDEGEGGEPFLTIPDSIRSEPFLDALVEGLRIAGYVAEVDNRQRVVAEALAEERKIEADTVRNKLFEVIDKLI